MQIATPNLTFNLWLIYMGDKTFTTNEVEPSYITGNVSFCDAWQTGYSIKRMNLVNDNTENMVYGDLPNLYLTKTGVSVNTLKDYSLTVVNGYLHFSDAYKNGIKVFDGSKNYR